MQPLKFPLSRFLCSLSLVVLLGGTAHGQTPITTPAAPNMNEVLVENRWAKVTRSDYETELLRLAPDVRGGFATSPKRVTDLLVRLLVLKSLAAQARAGDLYKDPELQRRRALEIDRVDAGILIAQIDDSAGKDFDSRRPQFEARARELYLVSADKYRVPEQVDASHILIDTRLHDKETALKLAQDVRAKLIAGADFGELAKSMSDDASAKQNSGHLGYFDRNTMDPAFTESAFALKNVGDLSQPVLSSFGYHIIRLDGRKPSRQKSFDEVLPEMMQQERGKYVAAQREERIAAIRDDPMSKMNQSAFDALIIKVDPEVARKALERAQEQAGVTGQEPAKPK